MTPFHRSARVTKEILMRRITVTSIYVEVTVTSTYFDLNDISHIHGSAAKLGGGEKGEALLRPPPPPFYNRLLDR
jgi:hypothetical protein